MASEKGPERGEHEVPGNARPETGPAPSSVALASRFQQMFPVLSPAELDRVRHFGDVRRFRPGEFLYQAGKPSSGTYVILSGRVAVIARRVAMIETGFGGPVLIGPTRSPEVTRLSGFLQRSGIPFRVFDPDEDADASSLLARFAPQPGDLPIVVISDGTVLKNPTKQDLARVLGLVATTLRSEPYDVAIVGAGPAGLAAAVYGASEGLSIPVLEALTFGGQAGASARIENYLGFPTGISGQALMARAFTQAQKFGAEFSLSTEVKQLDCTSESSGPDPALILDLADGRRVRARAVVVATGARYRRPEIPNLAQFEGRGGSYWASPGEAS